jgi:hypothetical protein
VRRDVLHVPHRVHQHLGHDVVRDVRRGFVRAVHLDHVPEQLEAFVGERPPWIAGRFIVASVHSCASFRDARGGAGEALLGRGLEIALEPRAD